MPPPRLCDAGCSTPLPGGCLGRCAARPPAVIRPRPRPASSATRPFLPHTAIRPSLSALAPAATASMSQRTERTERTDRLAAASGAHARFLTPTRADPRADFFLSSISSPRSPPLTTPHCSDPRSATEAQRSHRASYRRPQRAIASIALSSSAIGFVNVRNSDWKGEINVCVFGNRLEPGTGGQDASPRAVAGVSLLPASCPEREPAVTGQASGVHQCRCHSAFSDQ